MQGNATNELNNCYRHGDTTTVDGCWLLSLDCNERQNMGIQPMRLLESICAVVLYRQDTNALL